MTTIDPAAVAYSTELVLVTSAVAAAVITMCCAVWLALVVVEQITKTVRRIRGREAEVVEQVTVTRQRVKDPQ